MYTCEDGLLNPEIEKIGFEIEKQHFGLGLTNIKNRVAYLNGNLEIDSVPNQGTSINIQVSIHKNIIS